MILAFLLSVKLAAEQTGGEDRHLAERLKNRDTAAMAELYDRYGRLVYSVIFSVVRDSGVAEDLVQETFLRVWNRMQGFDSARGALGPWVLAVARNRAIDHVRSAAARMSQNSFEIAEHDHPSVFVDMVEDLFAAGQARHIRDAVKRLNENQRRCIELAYFEGLSQTEMADRMGQPLGTVKTWVRTALRMLREQLTQAAAI